MKRWIQATCLAVVLWSPLAAQAVIIQEYSVFLNTPTLGPSSLGHNAVGPAIDDFAGSGVGLSLTNGLGADGLGTLTWQFTNNTGATLQNARLLVLLDAEIDPAQNTFFNESGALVSVPGSGAGDSAPDSWEIDEPGFLFGDIYNNLLAGSLDNTNALPAGLEDDVSLALGFDLGNLLPTATWTAAFQTSLSPIGGLSHTDPDSLLTYFFNGQVNVRNPVTVPEPGPAGLLLLGMASLAALRRRFARTADRT